MKKILPTILLIIFSFQLMSQDPLRFQSEIDALVKRNQEMSIEEPIVFAGSFSFRMWKSMQEDLGRSDIINNGFGGSQMSDLIYFLDPLILDLKPKALYIYEGDNDLAEGKDPEQIVYQASKLIGLLQRQLPDLKVFIVSAKPSIARWKNKPAYIRFNMYMKEYCLDTEDVEFIDIWRAMLNSEGKPKASLFIEDELHMTKEGYQIWVEKIKPTLQNL